MNDHVNDHILSPIRFLSQ